VKKEEDPSGTMFQLFSHCKPSDLCGEVKESGIGYVHVLLDEIQRRGSIQNSWLKKKQTKNFKVSFEKMDLFRIKIPTILDQEWF
jgi:hypothetical protein